MTENEQPSLVSEFAAPFSYILGPITGLFFLVISKDDFVKFHARQSVVVFSVLIVLQIILGLIPYLSRLIPLLTILIFVLWLVLIYKAWLGDRWEVPVLGDMANRFASKRQE